MDKTKLEQEVEVQEDETEWAVFTDDEIKTFAAEEDYVARKHQKNAAAAREELEIREAVLATQTMLDLELESIISAQQRLTKKLAEAEALEKRAQAMHDEAQEAQKEAQRLLEESRGEEEIVRWKKTTARADAIHKIRESEKLPDSPKREAGGSRKRRK